MSVGAGYAPDSAVGEVARAAVAWHAQYPADWRRARELLVARYAGDPNWNSSRVNFGLTLLALLYGDGDYERTVTLATLAGWDNDINASTAGGLVGLMVGYRGLPENLTSRASDLYFNEDTTNLPRYDTLTNMAARTQALAEEGIVAAGGMVEAGVYRIPVTFSCQLSAPPPNQTSAARPLRAG